MRRHLRSTPPAGRIVRVLVAIALVAVVAPAATAHEGDPRALDAARHKVEQVGAALAAAKTRAADADAALREADAQLAALEEAVNEAAAALEAQAVAVEEAELRVGALEAEAAAQQEAFADRAASMFKRGVGGPLEAVLSAGSIAEVIDRSAYVQALSSSDRAALQAVVATHTAVDAERVRLSDERDRLEAMKAEQEALLAEVAELRQHRALQAAAARSEVGALERQKDDLEAESRRIARLIRERQEAAAAAAAAAKAASRSSGAVPGSVSTAGYAWPRCARVTSEYGRRWGRMHAGIDIDGNTGDAILASKAGVVIFAGWHGGYGRLTLIDHGDGVVTAYAHQSALAVGEGTRVSQGQRIGSVGNTGNSTGSHLHFETRVNGSAVNPRRFLPGGC